MSTFNASEPLRAVGGRVPGRRGLATRRKLIDCTIKLLATTPYRDLKITDITRAAGTSPATLYQYFVDLEDVLLAVADRAAEDALQLVNVMSEQTWRGARGMNSAEAMVDGFLAFWRTHRPTLRVLDLLSTEGDKRFRTKRVELLNPLTRSLAAEIERVNPNGGVEPTAMAGVLIGMLAQVAGHQSGFEAWDIDFSEVRESMIRLIYWGVTGPRLPAR